MSWPAMVSFKADHSAAEGQQSDEGVYQEVRWRGHLGTGPYVRICNHRGWSH
jgi:hypothetical protein